MPCCAFWAVTRLHGRVQPEVHLLREYVVCYCCFVLGFSTGSTVVCFVGFMGCRVCSPLGWSIWTGSTLDQQEGWLAGCNLVVGWFLPDIAGAREWPSCDTAGAFRYCVFSGSLTHILPGVVFHFNRRCQAQGACNITAPTKGMRMGGVRGIIFLPRW